MASDHHAPIATIPTIYAFREIWASGELSLLLQWQLHANLRCSSGPVVGQAPNVEGLWGSLEATENCATRTMCMCTWLDDRCSMLQPAIVMCVGNWQWFQCMGGGLVSSIIAIDSILQHLNTGGIWYGVVGIVPQWVTNLAPSATNHGLIRRTKHGICLLAGFGRAWWWTRGHSINRSATKFGRLLPS